MVATNNLKYILNNDRKNLCTRNDEPWSSNTMVSGYFGDDGTLYVSTTSAIAANSNLYFADSFILQAGVEYKFGLCPGSGPVRLALVNANGEWVANQFGTTPSTYTPSATGTFSMYVYIYSGTNVTNHPITPMICPTAVWDYDSTYVQPARTNAELTVLEASDRAGLVDVVDSGAKNLLNLETCTISSTHSAITFTVSGNTITVSSTGASDVQEVQIKNLSLPVNVDLALSGCPAGGSESTYLVDAFNNGGYIQGQTGDTGNGEIIKFTTMTNSRIRIRVAANATFTNKVFNLMVCTKAAFGVSSKFVPYRPNWDLVCSVNKYEKTNMTFTTDAAITNVFDLGNSYAYQYYNAFLGKVIVYMDLLTKANISTLDSKTIAWVKNGTNNTYNFEWTQPVTSGDALFRFTKPNTSTGVVIKLQSGTVASGVHIYVRFEYDIY